MRKFFTLTIAIFFANILFAQNIIGSWSGVLNVSNTKLQVVFNITQQDSSYTSTMDSPDQGAFGLPTTRTTFADNKLEIVATGLGIYYQGILAGDSIVGSFNQGGISFPLILKKRKSTIQSSANTSRTLSLHERGGDNSSEKEQYNSLVEHYRNPMATDTTLPSFSFREAVRTIATKLSSDTSHSWYYPIFSPETVLP